MTLCERYLKPCTPYLLLMVVAYLAYANTFGNSWTYDDFPVIVDNPDVRSWAGFLHNSYPGRPLRELTYLIDFSLFGLEPAGWHIQQIFWHGLNACLVYLLGRRLKVDAWAAMLASLLFLLHPLQVEVVANLSHRKDSLALAGTLGAIVCYAGFVDAERKRPWWLVCSIVCFVLAVSAKQTAVLVPVAWFFYEMFLVTKEKRVLARSHWTFVGTALAVLAIVLWVWQNTGGWKNLEAAMQATIATKTNYLEPVNLMIYYLTVIKSWAFSALRLVWPVDLAPEYTFPIAKSFRDGWVLGGSFLVGGSLFLIAITARRSPVLAWSLLVAILLYLPTGNLWPLTYLAADRYLYAPLAFLSLFWGVVLVKIPLYRPLVVGLAGALLVLLASFTWSQNQVWKTPQALWEQAVKVSPESSFALNNLGNLAFQSGALEKAEAYYRSSIKVNKFNPTAHYNLGMLAENKQDMKTSFRHYRAFARINSPLYREELRMLRSRLLRSYGFKL